MVKYEPDTYSGGFVTRAYWNGHYIATFVRRGDQYTLRWGHLDHPAPGYIETFASEAGAKTAIEAFVDSLDFEPWSA